MITKPSQIAGSNQKLRVLIAGHPGIGKTTLALSAPKPLLIDSDLGVQRVHVSHRTDCIRMESYKQIKEDLKGDLSDYETIVIDTGGELLNLMKISVIGNDIKNSKSNGDLSLQGFGAVGQEFASFCRNIFYDLHKHLVIIFHAKEEKVGEDTVLRIMVEGQTKNTIWQSMEIGGFIEIAGNKRILSLENSERHFGKCTHGIPARIEIPQLGCIKNGQWVETAKNDLLTRLFDLVNDNIKKEIEIYSGEKEAYETAMAYGKECINAITRENFNEAFAAMKNIKHALTSEKEIKELTRKKLTELGIVYDAKEKKYVIPNNSKSA
ncbi:MAG: ATP-binding protein [Deferribacteraceae bacterium]|jgi:hypothetical protein|nr:ATP-binding protein [Deferribacteraceae bacterium]